ncbi:hypothetical protein [uncultured Nisaea sp.]|uniref:hypothetical protein n=1 Tax=uncultured Nisaea sp. TaxID=538215 RepID=UPI0030EC70FD|tara:strand:- start:117 stop:338 length:222 start_codon:yes stop_codon:yes gene_type:complete
MAKASAPSPPKTPCSQTSIHPGAALHDAIIRIFLLYVDLPGELLALASAATHITRNKRNILYIVFNKQLKTFD